MKTYLLLSTVLIISFLAAYTLPTDEIIRGIFASPGFVALFIALYQILKDQNTHERNIDLQRRQQIFNIGATSHMANVAFDKHVEFCEKYMQEVHKTVVTLYREGPTTKALNHAGEFYLLRQEYAAWLTDEINEKLIPFEQALRSLGAEKGFITDTTGHPEYNEGRSEKIKKIFDDFKRLLTIDVTKPPDPEIAVEVVKKKVREILDIEDLVQLRKALISEARNTFETHNNSLNQGRT